MKICAHSFQISNALPLRISVKRRNSKTNTTLSALAPTRSSPFLPRGISSVAPVSGRANRAIYSRDKPHGYTRPRRIFSFARLSDFIPLVLFSLRRRDSRICRGPDLINRFSNLPNCARARGKRDVAGLIMKHGRSANAFDGVPTIRSD